MRKWRGFADNEASPVVIISSETLQITKSALPILGKPWSGRAVFFLLPLAGLCSEFVFCWAGVALHSTPAYKPPSLRDLGYGTKEPQRGDRILGRRWSIAEPLSENGKNPTIKNVVVSVILFIFAVRNQQKYKCVHVQSISMTV